MDSGAPLASPQAAEAKDGEPAAGAPSWRHPRRALEQMLERQYRSRGRLRVNIVIGCACISITSLALISMLDFGYLQGRIGAPPERFFRELYLSNVLLVALITAAAYAVLHFGLVRPLEYYRGQMRGQSRLKGQEQDEAIAALTFDRDRRSEQLDAALTDNEVLRGKLQLLAASQGQVNRVFRSTMETMTDRLILVGDNGRVTEISPFAAEMLGLSRQRVIGRDFDDVVRLFDAGSDKPQQHRLLGLAREAIEAASDTPRIIEALFAPMHGEAVRILVSVAAITEGQGRASGALIRLEPYKASDTQAIALKAQALDYVTGLPGRDQMEARLRDLLGNAGAASVSHSLLFLAIDNLSAMTDGLGYLAAEGLVYGGGEILREKVGTGGTCYRAGAEVIGALLPPTGAAQAQELARKVHAEVGARVFSAGELRFESSVSIGLAEITPGFGGVELAMQAAHAALAAARREGRGLTHVYAAADSAPQQRRSDEEWSRWLRERLSAGFLRLASQEIRPLAAGAGSLPMFEVFVRIEDEDGVWITPGAFLGAAERHQLTAKLDLEVFQAALGQLQLQPELTEKYACACINLSAASFASEGFAGELLQTLAMSGVPGHRICFEIDEADALSHKAALRRFIDIVRPAGVRFSMDRYRAIGGLYELRAVPLDFIKLHESLLHCLDPGLKDAIGLKHLQWASDIAQAMNIGTIATGIENEAMLEPLKSVGIRYVQGLAINKLGPLLLA